MGLILQRGKYLPKLYFCGGRGREAFYWGGSAVSFPKNRQKQFVQVRFRLGCHIQFYSRGYVVGVGGYTWQTAVVVLIKVLTDRSNPLFIFAYT